MECKDCIGYPICGIGITQNSDACKAFKESLQDVVERATDMVIDAAIEQKESDLEEPAETTTAVATTTVAPIAIGENKNFENWKLLMGITPQETCGTTPCGTTPYTVIKDIATWFDIPMHLLEGKPTGFDIILRKGKGLTWDEMLNL